MTNYKNTRAFKSALTVAIIFAPFTHGWAAGTHGNPLERSRPLPPEPPVYLANYGFLKNSIKRTDFLDPLRYIPIGQSSWLQLGGGVRLANKFSQNANFGLPKPSNDGYWETRYQLHADLHLFNDAFRTFVQLEQTKAYDKQRIIPLNESDTEVHQAFFDGRLPTFDHAHGYLRFGRQEMMYGRGALFSLRVKPNVRRTYDGFRASYKTHDGYALSLFAVRPVATLKLGSFNDSSHDDGKFYGIYSTIPWRKAFRESFYALGFNKKDVRLNGLAGKENLYSVGTRLFGHEGSIDYSWDFIYQFGTHAGQQISAWAVSSSSGYTFKEIPLKPDIGLRFDAASGDNSPSDNKSNTFNALFTAIGKFYGGAGLTTLSNVVAIGPRMGIQPMRSLKIGGEVLDISRQSTKDDVYMAGMRPFANSKNVTGRRIATDYDFSVRWRANSNITLYTSYDYYNVSDGMKNAGGKDSKDIETMVTFRF